MTRPSRFSIGAENFVSRYKLDYDFGSQGSYTGTYTPCIWRVREWNDLEVRQRHCPGMS
jgi:hypothetical protein